ncbi:TetR/AcrR family transcriptional regulator [Nonomuraea sp. NPDC050451]|uniref:TetR/AcrR family transcriptional regulator n=1 Tax=Nonomuraea sp. NPDC050451 TaxID=3364364 RepID=UPI00379035AD
MMSTDDLATTGTPAARPAGRPRNQEADTAILAAALDLLIEYGAQQTSIEQVAKRAGVTRATVYRRYADKTALLVRTLQWALHDNDPAFTGWRDLDHMFTEWALHLADSRNRVLLRRVFGTVDDYPELVRTYRETNGGRRATVVHAALAAARERGELPPGLDLDVVQELLTSAVTGHLVGHPDDEGVEEIKEYFLAIMRQVGYQRHFS